ncbi:MULTISPECIES: snapalysin family zinc-dependent metalloprotease [Streptomyces]|uniref:snapalysin family zinc-dependent metalloprotease n=2 Tax=Streptomyces TaxID=1883 RepID=UPI001D130BD4|nr:MULTISPECIES: snapalysin family zinc-dependent metalloprotease [Streptomyces]
MIASKAARALVALLVVALTWTTGQAFAASTAGDGEQTLAARVVTYDVSGAAEFTSAVHQGAAAWNATVSNVRLVQVQSGQRANVRVVADNGWPRAQRTSLGNGTVWMGRQAVNEGYNTVRIASHEFGHILGLPDIKPGPCSSLMSGSTAGVSCTNPYPNASERSAVERYFAGSLIAPARTFHAEGAPAAVR